MTTNPKTMAEIPTIKWVKLDSEKHCYFIEGSRFLVALQVRNSKTNKTNWEFDVVLTNCDGEGMSLMYEGGDYYDKWDWFDFEYFCLLDGEMPMSKEQYEKT